MTGKNDEKLLWHFASVVSHYIGSGESNRYLLGTAIQILLRGYASVYNMQAFLKSGGGGLKSRRALRY